MKIGDLVRFNHERVGGPVHRVVSVMRDGKIEVHDIGGYFAPQLFTVAKDADIEVRILAVVEAPTEDFAELLEIGGLDPTRDLRYADWSSSDFGEADVTGWDFTGARLNYADLRRVKNIELAIFNRNLNSDTETEFVGTLLPDGITVEQLMGQA